MVANSEFNNNSMNNNKIKALNAQLADHNDNQREWVRSARVAAGRLATQHLLSQAYPRTRNGVRANHTAAAMTLKTKTDTSAGGVTGATEANTMIRSCAIDDGDVGDSSDTPIAHDDNLGAALWLAKRWTTDPCCGPGTARHAQPRLPASTG